MERTDQIQKPQLKSLPVAKKLKLFRKGRGVSQEEMGLIIGVNQSQYSKYERGIQSLTVCQLIQFSEWFDVLPSFFFEPTQIFEIYKDNYL